VATEQGIKINVNGVEVQLPPGMSQEQYLKLTSTFLTSHVQGKKRDQAIQKAVKALKAKYPTEWKTLLGVELKKEGLPVKS